jgi:cob(I)alamin adenosyltransferase
VMLAGRRATVRIPAYARSFEVVEAVARRAERRLVVLAVDGHVAGIGISD